MLYIKKYNKRHYKFIKEFFILLFIIVCIISMLSYFSLSKFNPTKNVCLCLIAKNENKYIKEFVEYYKNFRIDKIFLYDNNDLNGENFQNAINNYIKKGFVELINFRGISTAQLRAYNDCYQKNKINYDWLIFFDADEFIYLKDFNNIKLFLGDKRFYKCEGIQLNYVYYTDNNLIYYENKSVIERFPERSYKMGKKVWHRSNVKSIIRGNLKNISITNVHYLSSKIKSCNGFGNKVNIFHLHTLDIDFNFYYLIHYFSKSLEEFVEKLMRTDAVYSKDSKMKRIKQYLKYNSITKEKLHYLENATKINIK